MGQEEFLSRRKHGCRQVIAFEGLRDESVRLEKGRVERQGEFKPGGRKHSTTEVRLGKDFL